MTTAQEILRRLPLDEFDREIKPGGAARAGEPAPIDHVEARLDRDCRKCL
jgi:hypothetical protein